MRHYCRQASKLVSQACDRPLTAGERLRLRFHLLMCGRCRNHARDVAIMEAILAELRKQPPRSTPGLTQAQRRRIRTELARLREEPG